MSPPPRPDELRELLATLRERLADFDGHPGTALARQDGALSGYSRARWEEAEEAVARARRTHDRVASLVGRMRRWSAERGPGGDDDPVAALQRDVAAVQRAIDRAALLHEARTDHANRARVAESSARVAGEAGAAEEAGALWRRISSDPLSSDERELVRIERRALRAGMRAALGFLARLGHRKLDVERAAEAVHGYQPGLLPDLNALAHRLDRIQALGRDRAFGRALADLDRWWASVKAAEAQVEEEAKAADATIARRRRLRGHLEGLKAKAADLGQRERSDVVENLVFEAHQLLYREPGDLAAAERVLLALERELERHPGREAS